MTLSHAVKSGNRDARARPRYNSGYTSDMKTAVSIPDSLFKAAEKAAKQAGLSRSELYAKALAEYVEKRRDDWITEQVKKVCADVDTSLDAFGRELQARSIPREEW